MDEEVILVDINDNILGYMNKLEAFIRKVCYTEQFQYLFLTKVMKCSYKEDHSVSIILPVSGVIHVVIQEKMNQFLNF